METDTQYNEQLTEDERLRFMQEEQDEVLNAIPPSDIIAFTEQRSCADILRMYENGQLIIQPDFQRGDVWGPTSQTLFIDSLMKQLPIPSLCISLDISSQKRMVIDGLQRIRTIIKFLGKASDKEYRLANSNAVDQRISGKTVSQIRGEYPELYSRVENVTLPITILRCDYSKKTHMQYLYQIFHRLNSGGNKLYNQEIRNCIYQGPFNTFLKSYVRSDSWLTFCGITPKDVDKARFRYEEQLLRFFAFYNRLAEYRGGLATFLNEYMEENKNSTEEQLHACSIVINETIQVALNISDLSTAINVREAVLIGIAMHLDILKTKSKEEINTIYHDLLNEPIFSKEELKEGLSAKEKVKERINCAIAVFGR